MSGKSIGMLLVVVWISSGIYCQKFYTTSGGELIFSKAQLETPSSEDIPVNFRFSFFLHLSHYWNFDITNNLGFFSGLSMRNIGFNSREDFQYKNEIFSDVKTKRRSYALGLPAALKLGSFRDHMFLYGGGQYEWMFHYKEKHFPDGNKVKSSEWFSDQTNPLVPSLFVGMQFPKGANLRFTWMLDNFLNPSQFPMFDKCRLYYISLSFNFKTQEAKEKLRNNPPKNYALKP